MSRMFEGFGTLRRALALPIVLALCGLTASAPLALGKGDLNAVQPLVLAKADSNAVQPLVLANADLNAVRPLVFPQICPQRRNFFNAYDLLNYGYYRYNSDFGYYYEMGNYEYWYNAGFSGWQDGGQDHPDYYCGMVQWH